MATLQSVAELSWRNIFPNPGDETSITKEEFIATAKNEWAYQTLLMCWNERATEGYYEPPSYLLTEIEKEVVDGEMDISDLETFKSLPQESWLVNIGGICECKYVKSTANMTQLMCDDDSLPDATKTYYVQGKKIKFPKGVHKKTLSITFANMGNDVDNTVEVDEAIAALIRVRLNEIYLGKVPPSDTTNNTNPNS